MHDLRRGWIGLLVCAAFAGAVAAAPADASPGRRPPARLAEPVGTGRWIVPASDGPAKPVWGIKGGLVVGLWPMPGPRGLIRIYAPYLGHLPGRMINFIAVEPIVGRRRGLSELEPSSLDGTAGKRMWAAQSRHKHAKPALPWLPGRPKFSRIEGAEAMTFVVPVEPFRSGARPVLEIVLRQDRPYEVALRVFSAEGGARMEACCLTATMGNYARLRRLWLKGRAIEPERLWPGFRPAGPRLHGFARHRQWPVEQMVTINGQAVAAATCDEADPAAATYDRGVARFWRYTGRPAVQYWGSKARPGLVVRVNGRRTYWNSTADIPGGVSFENFELQAPFEEGQEFRFGVAPKPSDFRGVSKQWLESTRRRTDGPLPPRQTR